MSKGLTLEEIKAMRAEVDLSQWNFPGNALWLARSPEIVDTLLAEISKWEDLAKTQSGAIKEFAAALPVDENEELKKLALIGFAELFASDMLALRKLWNEHLPEGDLEQIANGLGYSFD